MTGDSLFAWAVGLSMGAHVLGLTATAGLGLMAPAAPAAAPVPIEIVAATPPPPAPPPPPPKPERVVKPRVPRTEPARPAPVPEQPARLLDDAKLADLPAPPIDAPSDRLPSNALAAAPNPAVPGPREGGPAGAGELFSTGDFAVRPGSGTTGGSGAAGRAGTGLASAGNADPVGAAGVTSFARPLGGYQTIPRYPESARRAGIEGVAMLRFVVLADGHVDRVQVQRSAGHVDLDQSAVEAVKTWLFEPARRGKEPVPVWVTLPVRFSLSAAH